jgi:DNA-binding beta-propeller fold protein YncE
MSRHVFARLQTPDDRYLIVASAASNELVFLDPATGGEIRRLPNISDPYQIGFSPDKKWFLSASNRLDRELPAAAWLA